MTSSEKIWALTHLVIDVFIVSFLVVMIRVGLTEDPNAFFVWVPLLTFLTWVRFRQARAWWSL